MSPDGARHDESHQDDLSAHILLLEESLLNPATRRDRARVSALLSSEFEEFGASGRVWTREEIIDALAGEEFQPLFIEDFKCRIIAPGVALATYRSVRTDPNTGAVVAALRSSVWVEESAGWRVRFHQGTRLS